MPYDKEKMFRSLAGPDEEIGPEGPVFPQDMFSAGEIKNIKAKQTKAEVVGIPSVNRVGELLREGIVSGVVGGLKPFAETFPAAIPFPEPGVNREEQLRKAFAPEGVESRLQAVERSGERVRGLLSQSLSPIPSPMEPAAGKRVPEMLPPANFMEQALFRAGEFLVPAFPVVGVSRLRNLGDLGFRAMAGKTAGAAAGTTLTASGLAGVSILGEEFGGSVGRAVGNEESGRFWGRITGELVGGVLVPAATRTAVGVAVGAAKKVGMPVYRRAVGLMMGVFDKEALNALNINSIEGLDKVQSKLNDYLATREGQRLRIAMEGAQPVPQEIARITEKAFAEMGLPLQIDLATRTGSNEMRAILRELQQKDLNLRVRAETDIKTVSEGLDRMVDQVMAGKRQASLNVVSRDLLDALEKRQADKVAQLSMDMEGIASRIRQEGANFPDAGKQYRQALAKQRNAAKAGFQAVYQKLDNDGNQIAAQLPEGGYRLDAIMNFINSLRSQPDAFRAVHGALARYDRAGRSFLKEIPANSADNLPGKGDFPELMDDDVLTPELRSAEDQASAMRDADAYTGQQAFPSDPQIPIDPSAFEPVSFQTMRYLHRDIGRQMRKASPELRGDLLQLKRMVEQEMATKTPELFSQFKAVQQDYKTNVIDRYQRGPGGAVLAENSDGSFKKYENDVLEEFWKRGPEGARQAREYAIDLGESNPLRTYALSKLATAIGLKDPTKAGENFQRFLDDNRPFLEEAGLMPYFRDLKTSMDGLDVELQTARAQKLQSEKALLQKFINAPEIQIGDKEDIGSALRAVMAIPEERQALLKLMSDSGSDELRSAVIGTYMRALNAPRSAKPYDELVQLKEVVGPLLETHAPGTFAKMISFAAASQVMKSMDAPARPHIASSVAARDPLQEAIGTTMPGLVGRIRNLAMGYTSKIFTGFELLSRYGIKISRERADRLLAEAMYDPEAADQLMKLMDTATTAGVKVGGAETLKRGVLSFNRYALENGMTMLLFETTEREPPPEPLPRF